MAAVELFNTPLFNDPNLVSYWRMEGNSNDAKDGNNGSDTNITYSSGNGMFGQGAGFNGTTSRIAIADAANLRITGALTITAWVKPNDATPNKNMVVFAKGNQNSPAAIDYTITLQNRKIRAIVSNGSATNDLLANSTMSDNTYHLISMVYVPSTSLTLYLDGAQDGQTTSSIISAIQSTNNAASIGRDGDAAQFFFNGNIDELAIFNRALTANEISNLYNGFPLGGAFLLNFL